MRNAVFLELLLVKAKSLNQFTHHLNRTATLIDFQFLAVRNGNFYGAASIYIAGQSLDRRKHQNRSPHIICMIRRHSAQTFRDSFLEVNILVTPINRIGVNDEIVKDSDDFIEATRIFQLVHLVNDFIDTLCKFNLTPQNQSIFASFSFENRVEILTFCPFPFAQDMVEIPAAHISVVTIRNRIMCNLISNNLLLFGSNHFQETHTYQSSFLNLTYIL